MTLAGDSDVVKQPLMLCHVAGEIFWNTKHQSLHFLIVGGGTLQVALENCISEEEMEPKFSFLGHVSAIGMREVLSASDILFFSSPIRGIPTIFYEAMAAGLPIIGPNVGGVAELILNDITGQVVNIRNGSEFHYTPIHIRSQIQRYTSALLKIIDSSGTARKMGALGRDRIKADFNLAKTIKEFIKHVSTKINQKSKRKEDDTSGMGSDGMLDELGELCIMFELDVCVNISFVNAYMLNALYVATMGLGQGVTQQDKSPPTYCLLI